MFVISKTVRGNNRTANCLKIVIVVFGTISIYASNTLANTFLYSPTSKYTNIAKYLCADRNFISRTRLDLNKIFCTMNYRNRGFHTRRAF